MNLKFINKINFSVDLLVLTPEKLSKFLRSMSQLLLSIIDGYRDVMDNKSDPRVSDWFMMSSPFPTLFICLFYAYFAKRLGPNLMKKREPFDLRNTLVLYNFFQFIFSIWMFYELGQSGWWTGYNLTCQPVDYSTDLKALRMARISWWYYISKFTEFFDTFFFILRKKNNQATNLHVIHHGIMPFSVWMGVKFTPGGHSTFFVFLNTFVHAIMYMYYMITAMGPKYQKYVWWKKYLTTIQMVQFVLIFIHQFQLLFIDCNYPKSFTIYIGLHGVLFLFLFSDFYKDSYLSKGTGVCMPVEDHKKRNGETSKGFFRHKCKEDQSENCKLCYTDLTGNGFISHDDLISVRKKD